MRDPVHPRPQFAREVWKSLDGPWDYAFAQDAQPDHVTWQGHIQVPFAPESALSGVHDTGFHPCIWYRRSFRVPEAWAAGRVLLHLGAVDYAARVFVNGHLVVTHEGGHTPFSADVTDVLVPGEQVVTVRAEDDPHDLAKPRGKQDWQLEPHAIWYPRTTGIWQSVWLEPVPLVHLERVRYSCDVDALAVSVEVDLTGIADAPHAGTGLAAGHRDGAQSAAADSPVAEPLGAGQPDALSLEATLTLRGRVLAFDRWSAAATTADGTPVAGPTVARTLRLPPPGQDELDGLLWSPEHPNLIRVRLRLLRGEAVLDEVASYTALRSVSVEDGRFLLNGRPYFLRMALDQGYWEDGLLTAPDDAALRRDVELAKAMGFNGVRKHQKIEDPRYLAWADELGLLVWAEMPSAYAFSSLAAERLTREWLEVLRRDRNHPCIVAWVCFNESWGVPQLPRSAPQRALVRALYQLARSLDPSRPVIGNDGWEHVVTDLLTVHDYATDPAVLAARYRTPEATAATLATQRPNAGKAILLAGVDPAGLPVVLSEFGGVRFHAGEEGWGYQQVDDAPALLRLYAALVEAASGAGLAGFCYTQFADTFQEQNGLLRADRRPKVALDDLAAATRGRGVRP